MISQSHLLDLPVDVLQDIICLCFQDGWKILLSCKYICNLAVLIKSKWFNTVKALRHAAHCDYYDIAMGIDPETVNILGEDDKNLIMKCVVSGIMCILTPLILYSRSCQDAQIVY
jgi:hypothetical protein